MAGINGHDRLATVTAARSGSDDTTLTQTIIPSSDVSWYDGNTFQCLQCGFMSRSLEQFDSHVKNYHNVSMNDFSPYIAKTSLMYRCQFCLAEVYHEKSVIVQHLAFHNLDIESYSNIYERGRTLY